MDIVEYFNDNPGVITGHTDPNRPEYIFNQSPNGQLQPVSEDFVSCYHDGGCSTIGPSAGYGAEFNRNDGGVWPWIGLGGCSLRTFKHFRVEKFSFPFRNTPEKLILIACSSTAMRLEFGSSRVHQLVVLQILHQVTLILQNGLCQWHTLGPRMGVVMLTSTLFRKVL